MNKYFELTDTDVKEILDNYIRPNYPDINFSVTKKDDDIYLTITDVEDCNFETIVFTKSEVQKSSQTKFITAKTKKSKIIKIIDAATKKISGNRFADIVDQIYNLTY